MEWVEWILLPFVFVMVMAVAATAVGVIFVLVASVSFFVAYLSGEKRSLSTIQQRGGLRGLARVLGSLLGRLLVFAGGASLFVMIVVCLFIFYDTGSPVPRNASFFFGNLAASLLFLSGGFGLVQMFRKSHFEVKWPALSTPESAKRALAALSRWGSQWLLASVLTWFISFVVLEALPYVITIPPWLGPVRRGETSEFVHYAIAIVAGIIWAFVDFVRPRSPRSLGREAYRRGNYDLAIAELTKGVNRNPADAKAHVRLGEAYELKSHVGGENYTEELRQQDVDRAIACYTEVIRLQLTARNYECRGKIYAGIRRGDWDRAIADYSEAIRLEPTAARYTERARFYNLRGDYQRSAADCSAAIRIQPTADGYASRADAYMQLGDRAHAFADYDTAIKRFPSDEAYKKRATAFQSIGDHDRAIADYSAAIRLASGLFNGTSRDINLGYLYAGRADVYVAKGDYDRAIVDCGKFIELIPTSSLGCQKRGDLYNLKGDAESAIADFTEMTRIESDSAWGKPYLGFLKRAQAYLSMYEFEKAISDYSESIQLNPIAETYIGRGDAYRTSGGEALAIADYDAAIAIAEADIEPKPEDEYTIFSRNQAKLRRAYAYIWSGVVKQRKGDWSGSKTDISAAQGIIPQVAEQFSAYLV
jgi:tetratricopeptide (TPR) repeat protein